MKVAAVALLVTFEAIDAAWFANYKDGRIVNLALSRRLAARERALAIEILGFDSEEGKTADQRYAATSGELKRWAKEKLAAA